jgi:tetratricopeptide (TPR) repeat protein
VDLQGSRPDPELSADLGAALLERSRRLGTLVDAIGALEQTEAALRLDSRSLPALFNRALALENLKRVNEARQAWQEYLAVDSRSPWSEEARAHLRATST